VRSISRIKDAQYLRGQKLSFKRILIPLLEESLARSLDLAAAMDSRGYGSTRVRSRYRAISWNPGDSLIIVTSALTLFSPALILLSVVAPFLLFKRRVAVPA
jgi:energy-coupling factor transporter transmembrane protein EcfT